MKFAFKSILLLRSLQAGVNRKCVSKVTLTIMLHLISTSFGIITSLSLRVGCYEMIIAIVFYGLIFAYLQAVVSRLLVSFGAPLYVVIGCVERVIFVDSFGRLRLLSKRGRFD